MYTFTSVYIPKRLQWDNRSNVAWIYVCPVGSFSFSCGNPPLLTCSKCLYSSLSSALQGLIKSGAIIADVNLTLTVLLS
jgi:hypothetical protein